MTSIPDPEVSVLVLVRPDALSQARQLLLDETNVHPPSADSYSSRDQEAQNSNASAITERYEVLEYDIDNKYYTATINLIVYPEPRVPEGLHSQNENESSSSSSIVLEKKVAEDFERLSTLAETCAAFLYIFNPDTKDDLWPDAIWKTLERQEDDEQHRCAISLPWITTSESQRTPYETFSDICRVRGFDYCHLGPYEGLDEDEMQDASFSEKKYDAKNFLGDLELIMWPNMKRKPTVPRSERILEETSLKPNDIESHENWPVNFTTIDSSATKGFDLESSARSTQEGFQEDLLDELHLTDERRAEEAKREYESWLESDPPISFQPISEEKNPVIVSKSGQEGFEDDFGPLQSYPSKPASRPKETTQRQPDVADIEQIFQHLNRVREQLGHVGDEDERRLKAGREVERVLAGLGLDWSDDDEEDGGVQEDEET